MRPLRPLWSYLFWRIGGLVVLTALLLGVSVYGLLSRRLEREFERRLAAQRGQVAVLLEARLNEVRSRLQDVAQNNAVRVTLMLGVLPQLRETLGRLDSRIPGLWVAVRPLSGPLITGRPLPDWAREAADAPPQPRGGLTWRFEEPIVRRTERLGTALALYRLPQDRPFLERLRAVAGGDLSLDTGAGPRALLPSAVGHEDARIAPIPGFPELLQVASSAGLRARKRQVLGVILACTLAALLVSWGVALRLAHGVGEPLARLARVAHGFSEGRLDMSFSAHPRFAETAALAAALQSMLASLSAAEELARYREIFHSVVDPVLLIDPTGRLLEVNDALCERLGTGRDDLVGQDLRAHLPPADVAAMLRRSRTGQPLRLRTRLTPPGAEPVELDVAARLVPFRGGQAVLAVARDVTDQVRAEALVRENHAFLQWIIDHLDAAVLILDPRRRVRFYNRPYVELWGLEPELLDRGPAIGDLIREVARRGLYPRDDAESLVERRLGELARATPHGIPIEIPRRDGVEVEGYARRMPDGGLLLTYRDVTERTRRERERALLASAVAQAAEGIAIATREGRLLYVNPAYERITGCPAREALGRPFWEVPQGSTLRAGPILAAAAEGRPWKSRHRTRRSDGTAYEEDCIVSPVTGPGEGETFLVVVTRDITREVTMERQLVQVQKMEALGTLAGGIAHDFNNILMSIVAHTELALGQAAGAGRENLARVLEACERARDLVGQILTFARPTRTQDRPCLLAPLVKETLKLMRASLPPGIRIRERIEVEPGRDRVVGDPTQFHQVVMNLCTNATHAMGAGGGVLEVGLRCPDEDPGRLELWVRDTGSGIPPEILERVFEPFFTTKPPGEGTGLGLALVHSIVRRHGGRVTIESEPGRGTTVRVRLPRDDGAGTADPLPQTPPAGGTERVLLVDDEPDIVDAAVLALEGLGYRVTGLTDPRRALDALERDPAAFDVLITDLVMPGLDGEALIRRARALRPGLPAVLCTGASPPEGPPGVTPVVVTKPFRTTDLDRALRTALEEGGEPWQAGGPGPAARPEGTRA